MAEGSINAAENILLATLPGNNKRPKKRTPRPQEWTRNRKKKARLQDHKLMEQHSPMNVTKTGLVLLQETPKFEWSGHHKLMEQHGPMNVTKTGLELHQEAPKILMVGPLGHPEGCGIVWGHDDTKYYLTNYSAPAQSRTPAKPVSFTRS
ncbi:unnamed protein product [Allacma fusca]|uniref:Uncharacterized protein n=1 Tax=Allacma fusca TaxID=39272 RepID=A0A8J2LAM9_9HEXA|nr:unnamed protein product [Allacma fusca]